MKNYYFIFLMAFMSSFTSTPFLIADSGSWVKKFSSTTGKINTATSFTIGDYAYVGTVHQAYGQEKSHLFYKYDSRQNTWTEMAPLPNYMLTRQDAIGFSVNGKGYIVGGDRNLFSGNNCIKDCWEYNPVNDSWSQRVDFPRLMKQGIGFSIGNKAYVGLGTDYYNPLNDFYEFDPAANKWRKLNDFPAASRLNAVSFSLNGKGYVGLGYMYQNMEYIGFKDFWEYDPKTDSWTRLKDFPGVGRRSAVGYGLGAYCYVGMGEPNDFYRYNLETKEWESLGSISDEGRLFPYSFCVNKKIYYGGGEDKSRKKEFSDLWEFNKSDIATGIKQIKIATIYIYPNPVVEGFTVKGTTGTNTLVVTDLTGKQRLTKKLIESQNYISMDKIPQGVYLITIKDAYGHMVLRTKIIKQ